MPVSQQQPHEAGLDPAHQQRDPNRVYPSNPPKSGSTAVILSCLLTGIGQMYLGQAGKGLVLLVVALLIGAATAGFSAPVFWIVGMIDAHKIGNKLANGHSVGEWECF